ncbi:MAG: hypothetical protein QOI42_1249, partial [Frankiaceae bacterium]|nr:hypothetical protein [Frankiaceae bacterium]
WGTASLNGKLFVDFIVPAHVDFSSLFRKRVVLSLPVKLRGRNF